MPRTTPSRVLIALACAAGGVAPAQTLSSTSPPPRFLFQPLDPTCLVLDTRFAPDPAYAGMVPDGTPRIFSVRVGQGTGGPEDYSPQGGAYCYIWDGRGYSWPNGALLVVTVMDATANGWITFHSADAPDASPYTVSIYYTPGPPRSQPVFTLLAGDHFHEIKMTSRFGSVNVRAVLVGFYIRVPSEPLSCAPGPAVSQSLSTSGDSLFSINGSNGCPAGTAYTSLACAATGDTANVRLSHVDVASGTCAGVHRGTGAATVTATPWCCQRPGEPY